MENILNGKSCRCCLKEFAINEGVIFSLTYSDPSDNIPIYVKLKQFMDLGCEDVSKLKMCLRCISSLNHSYNFALICEKTKMTIKHLKETPALKMECDDFEERSDNSLNNILTNNFECLTQYIDEDDEIEQSFLQEDYQIDEDILQKYFEVEEAIIEENEEEEVKVITEFENNDALVECVKITDASVQKNHANLKLKCHKCQLTFNLLSDLLVHKILNNQCNEYRDKAAENNANKKNNNNNNRKTKNNVAMAGLANKRAKIEKSEDDEGTNESFNNGPAAAAMSRRSNTLELQEKYTKIPFKDPINGFKVKLPFPIPPAHQKKDLPNDVIGIIKKGNYTKAEDNIIIKNWVHFCQLHNWDKNNAEPFINLFEVRSKVLYSDQVDFLRFMGHDLPDRSLNSIYDRFKKVLRSIMEKTTRKRERFTEEEDKLILSYVQDDANSVKVFAELGAILDRPKQDIQARFNKLTGIVDLPAQKSSNSDKSTNMKEGSPCKNPLTSKKTTPEDKRIDRKDYIKNFIDTLLRLTSLNSVEELEAHPISCEVFKQMAESINDTYSCIRRFWYRILYPRLFIPQHETLNNIKRTIIEIMNNTKNLSYQTVDWNQISAMVPGTTRNFVYTLMYNLIKKHVPYELRNNLEKSIAYLAENFKGEKVNYKKVIYDGNEVHFLQLRNDDIIT